MGKTGQKIFRVILGQNIFDIASLNGVNIENDLSKPFFVIMHSPIYRHNLLNTLTRSKLDKTRHDF